MRVEGKRYSVIGAARSGIAVARLLKLHGAEVFVSDRAPAGKMSAASEELARAGVAYEFSANSPRVLEADMLVISPGVPSDAPIVQEALRAGRTVVSELEVASWFCPAPIVAVTGTNGKTTTTTLLGAIFERAQWPSAVGGNIGVAFSQIVGKLTSSSTAILEVSSFQLDHIASFRPRVAVLLNITPDHLDRYGHSYERYIAAKCRVFQYQQEGDALVYNADDATVVAEVERLLPPGVHRFPFSVERPLHEGAWVKDDRLVITLRGTTVPIIKASAIGIRGTHNLANAMAAVLAAKALGIPDQPIADTLASFTGVEHRLEFVRELDGVTYINDSKATNVDSVWYALQSFASPIVVMLGGRDKGNDYSRLHGLVRKHVRAVIAIGESADKVEQAFRDIVPVTKAGTMADAVQSGRRLAQRGDVVLLSPACASFDWFRDYEHRGRVFKELVAALNNGSAKPQ